MKRNVLEMTDVRIGVSLDAITDVVITIAVAVTMMAVAHKFF